MPSPDAFDGNAWRDGITSEEFEDAIFKNLSEYYVPLGYEMVRKPKVRGWSGHFWRPDIAVEKDGDIYALFECKNTERDSAPTTFGNNMIRAFAELSDIFHANMKIKCFVIYKEAANGTNPKNYSDLFLALNGAIVDPIHFMKNPQIIKNIEQNLFEYRSLLSERSDLQRQIDDLTKELEETGLTKEKINGLTSSKPI